VTGPPGPCGCGCALTPATSYGFDVEDFAATVLGTPLDPWERWLVIHAGELITFDMPRFRHVLVIVARQNGKTWLLIVLCLYWLFIEQHPMILSTSTNLDYAKEAWAAGVELAQTVPQLEVELPPGRNRGVRETNGQQTMSTLHRTKWKIAASNRRGGRSLSIDRLVMDELREHDKWDAWNAAVPATNARPNAQIWGISNMGDDTAVVLDSRRSTAIAGEDPRIGIFEWSAPEGSRADDPAALARANPNYNRRILGETLISDARAAMRKGGEELAKFLTEILCIAVRSRRPAVDAGAWADCLGIVDLAPYRSRTVVCIDVSIDGLHASAVAAAVLPDERVMVDVVAAWQGPDAAQQMKAELPALLRVVQPRELSWFPDGPAAVIAADMTRAAKSGRRASRFPARMKIEEITADTPAACMGLADVIQARSLVQPGDPMMDAHVCDAEQLLQGDRWRFTRRGVGHCDGAYATAGAVHRARILPPPPPPLSVA
jgi:phage terminase large subunit-like protein